MFRLLLQTPYDLAAWRRSGSAGDRPGLAPYGLEHLAAPDEVAISQWQPPRWLERPPVARLRQALERRTGMALARPLLSAARVRHADVVLAVLEREGYLHGLLRSFKVRPWSRVPVVYVACWLADEAQSATGLRLALLRRLARSADLIVFWSTNQERIYRELLGVSTERLYFVPFGIEAEFYAPAAEPSGEPYLFAAGRDRGRDYETLFAAVDGLPIEVRIACPLALTAHLDKPSNVRLLGEVDHTTYRSLLAGSTGVVITSHEGVAYPTGQTVMLNAMSCGRPVVITRSEALDGYVEDGVTAIISEPADPASVRAGIVRLLEDRELASTLSANGIVAVRDRFNTRVMWTAIRQRIATLVASEAGRRST